MKFSVCVCVCVCECVTVCKDSLSVMWSCIHGHVYVCTCTHTCTHTQIVFDTPIRQTCRLDTIWKFSCIAISRTNLRFRYTIHQLIYSVGWPESSWKLVVVSCIMIVRIIFQQLNLFFCTPTASPHFLFALLIHGDDTYSQCIYTFSPTLISLLFAFIT